MSALAGVAAPRVRELTNPARSAASLVAWATALTLTGSAWLVWLAGQPSTGVAIRTGPHGIAAWMMTSLLALPVVIGGVWVSTQLSRLVRGAIGAAPLTVAPHPVLVSSAVSTGLGTGWHLKTAFAGADPPVRELAFAVILVSPATLVATLLHSAVAGLTDRSPRPRASSSRRLVGSLASALVALRPAALAPSRFGDYHPKCRGYVLSAGTQPCCVGIGGTP
jgi:hypothetical protein